MALTKKPASKSSAAADAFIAAAPDAGADVVPVAPQKGVKMGNKRQITVTISPELLDRIDACASSRGLKRAAAFTVGMYEWVEKAEASQH